MNQLDGWKAAGQDPPPRVTRSTRNIQKPKRFLNTVSSTIKSVTKAAASLALVSMHFQAIGAFIPPTS